MNYTEKKETRTNNNTIFLYKNRERTRTKKLPPFLPLCPLCVYVICILWIYVYIFYLRYHELFMGNMEQKMKKTESPYKNMFMSINTRDKMK